MGGIEVIMNELNSSEFGEWKSAFKLKDADAVYNNIVENVKAPVETFAQCCARLGIGDASDPDVTKWYYNHNILYYGENNPFQYHEVIL